MLASGPARGEPGPRLYADSQGAFSGSGRIQQRSSESTVPREFPRSPRRDQYLITECPTHEYLNKALIPALVASDASLDKEGAIQRRRGPSAKEPGHLSTPRNRLNDKAF